MAPPTLKDSMLSLLDDKSDSDVTVMCLDKEWACHRAILRKRSEYFAKVLQPPYLENETNIIDLSETHPTVVEDILVFIYTGEFDGDRVTEEMTSSNLSCMHKAVLVWAEADMRLLDGLKTKVIKAVRSEHVEEFEWPKVEETIRLAWTKMPSNTEKMNLLQRHILDTFLSRTKLKGGLSEEHKTELGDLLDEIPDIGKAWMIYNFQPSEDVQTPRTGKAKK